MRPLQKRYRRYATGSDMSASTNLANGIGSAGAFVGSTIDALSPADEYKKKSGFANIGGGIAKGAAAGASFGPIGAAVGAGIGAITGIVANKQQRELANKLRSMERIRDMQTSQQQAQSRVSANPSIVYGNQGTLMNGYYAAGGNLLASADNVAKQPMEGGSATALNSTSAEINGPSHEEGGVKIPGMQSEVEGKETTNGSYVFSERLGFAQLHKPIAKAIGKIEKKALAPERINSLKLLKSQENNLKLSQEYMKRILDLT